jgi:hypothetical protein
MEDHESTQVETWALNLVSKMSHNGRSQVQSLFPGLKLDPCVLANQTCAEYLQGRIMQKGTTHKHPWKRKREEKMEMVKKLITAK